MGWHPYETTHPPLGKVIMMAGIEMFGMDPFGWRFMGTIFGIAMVPLMYLSLIHIFAAASIVAKVYRDGLMQKYDRQYPQYGFARNKGYGTAEHMEALRRYGPCPIHRRSFITRILQEADDAGE